MKRTVTPIIFSVCLVGLLALGFSFRGNAGRGGAILVPQVQAQAGQSNLFFNNAPCSNATLKGNYGVQFTGSAPGFGPFASVAIGSYDGEGNITGSGTANVNGQTVTGSITGKYTVNPDCTATGTITYQNLNLTVGGFAVLVNHGKEAFFVGTSPAGVLLNGSIKKIGD